MQETASRKRKMLPGSDPRSLKVVLEYSKPKRRKGSHKGKEAARKQIPRDTPSYEVSTDQEDQVELEDDDMSDCIVVVPHI